MIVNSIQCGILCKNWYRYFIISSIQNKININLICIYILKFIT